MKRIFISALCATALAASAGAQTSVPQKVKEGVTKTYDNAQAAVSRGLDAVAENVAPFKLGVQAGLNASTFSASAYDAKAGFHVGLTAIFDASDLLKNTYFRTGLLFQRKGATCTYLMPIYDEHSNPVDAHKVTDAYRTGYLEIPARYGYSYLLNSDWTLLGETGPYVAFALGGKIDRDFKLFSDGDAHRFDLGWGLHLGALLSQDHQLTLGWDWGFVNMSDALLQNRNFQISYAYYFR